MKCLILSLFLTAFVSCSRFNTPHYRKLKLVPATESAIFSGSNSVEEITPADARIKNCDVKVVSSTDSVTVRYNDTAHGNRNISRAFTSTDVDSFVQAESILKTTDKTIHQPLPVRRDWSVLIAILLLFGGIVLLLWSIAISIALPAPFWVRLLIGIGMIPLSVRMILLGGRILINRRRNPVNYKESQH
jgi:hypothetical protein